MLDFNVVTFHREYNYGAALQAYSLQQFIREMGYSVGVYDYNPNRGALGMKARILKRLQGIKPKDQATKQNKYQRFLAEKFLLNKENDSRIYVAGSDQVWNPTGKMDATYFLRFAQENSAKISYAASIGVARVPEDRKDLFERYIADFSAISVREETAQKCLSGLYSGDIEVNVDPVLLHDADFWKKNMAPVAGMPEKYVLVYLMHFPKNINRIISFLKKQTSLPVVLVDGQGGVQGRLSFLVKHDIALHDAGPDEFVWLVANAEAVVTSSFHAVAFSMLFKKELYPIVGNSLSSRITDLLRKVDFEPIPEQEKVFSRQGARFDAERVSAFLEKEREKSRCYLQKAYAICGAGNSAVSGVRIDLLQENCTGCGACAAACPTKAILMEQNEDGFYGPMINEGLCVSCNRCGEVCPQKAASPHDKALRKSWYGWSDDRGLCFESSSGGAVPTIMNEIVRAGGVVFSAVYDDDFQRVVFADSDHVPLKAFRKSKYVASGTEQSYEQVKEKLDTGRMVLFCGAPCQVAGLLAFLGVAYDNLITCDFICGGMPSAAFWKEHVLSLEKKYNSKVTGVDFRDKCNCWSKYRLTITFANGKCYSVPPWQDSYMASFYRRISIREVCLRCRYHSGHASDITVGDFWGYKNAGICAHKEGMSLIIANSERGKAFVRSMQGFCLTELDNQYSDYAYSELSMSAAQYVAEKSFLKCARQNGFEAAARQHCNTSVIHHAREWIKAHFGV